MLTCLFINLCTQIYKFLCVSKTHLCDLKFDGDFVLDLNFLFDHNKFVSFTAPVVWVSIHVGLTLMQFV